MSTIQGAVDFQDVAVMAANNATLTRNFQRRKKIRLEAHVLLGLSSREINHKITILTIQMYEDK